MANLFKLFLTRQFSFKVFIITQLAILICGIIFLTFLYYILNKDTPPANQLEFYAPVTSKVASLTLELDTPDDNILTLKPDLLISGRTLPHLKVLLTSQSEDLVLDAKKDGAFSTFLKLNEGVNYISVYVFSDKGDQKVAERTIFYSKEKL